MRLMVKITLFLFLVILIILIPSITLLWQNQQRTVLEQAHVKAQAIHQMIVITRQWVAENRERISPVPAEATKELSKYADSMASFRFHITSDKLINPENSPTPFEEEAIISIRDGKTPEFSRVEYEKDKGNVYKYAAPLYINESCLKCHDHQGYKVNDFRGIISISFPLSDIEKSLSGNSKMMFYTIVLGLFSILVMVCLLVYWMITRHLTTLTKATGDIRLGGRVKTNIKTDDEIQDLSEAFDLMSSQIANNEEVLKAKLDEAVSKYIELVQELETKNKTLGSLNQLKTDLLDSVSHEIRTPLTKILSYSELLNDPRVFENEELREKFAKSMKNNINAIKTMFNDIITLSRLEHEQHVYHKIPVNLYEMVKELSELFELDIKAKNLTLNIKIDKDDVIYVDGETFSTVISNLFSNAVKYSHQDGAITISAGKRNRCYIITCEDNGVGVPEEDIPKLFIRFHRGANVKKEFPGTGLGLSITERIISAHKGYLTVESELGKYTRVTIRLPLSEVGGEESGENSKNAASDECGQYKTSNGIKTEKFPRETE